MLSKRSAKCAKSLYQTSVKSPPAAMRRFHLHNATVWVQRHAASLPRFAAMNHNDPNFHVRLMQPGLFTVRAECSMMRLREGGRTRVGEVMWWRSGFGGEKVRKLEHIKHH